VTDNTDTDDSDDISDIKGDDVADIKFTAKVKNMKKFVNDR